MALSKSNKTEVPVIAEKNAAVAFVNWQLPLVDGRSLRSSKGFPLFQNPKYPNKQEDMLVALAKKHGGAVTVNLQCRIVINNGVAAEDFDLDSIEIVGAPATEAAVPVQ